MRGEGFRMEAPEMDGLDDCRGRGFDPPPHRHRRARDEVLVLAGLLLLSVASLGTLGLCSV